MTLAIVNQWPIGAINQYGLQLTNVTNTNGNALVAILGLGSNSQSVLPRFNVADDARNFWYPAGTKIVKTASRNRRVDVWIAPNASPASIVSLAQSWYTNGIAGVILEVSGFPTYAQVDFIANASGFGSSAALSGTATVADHIVGATLISNAGFTPAVTLPAGMTGVSGSLTGAFLSFAAMGEPSQAQAVTDWGTWTGQSLKVTREYFGLSSFPTVDANLTMYISQGVKVCLNLEPAFNPTSGTDLTNLNTMLSTWKAAGLNAEVSLWAEPFNAGLTIAQFHAMIAFYGPTVRTYYPLVFCTSAQSVQSNNENAYYTSDADFDKIASDLYAIRWLSGTTLDLAASIADNAVPPKPFGLWEFNGSPQGTNFLLGDNTTFDATAGTWTGAGNSTTARVTTPVHAGAGALSITSVASGDATAAHCSAASITTNGMPCSPGDQIATGAWVRTAVSARTVQTGATFYTSGGVLISTLFSTGATDSTTYSNISGTVTAPATAAFCRANVKIVATGAASEVHFIDDVTLANNSVGQTNTQITNFFNYLQNFMSARLAAGKINADMIFFNSGSASNAITTPIITSSDFRIGLWNTLAALILAVSTGSSSTDQTSQNLYPAIGSVSAGAVSKTWSWSGSQNFSSVLVGFKQTPIPPSQPNANWPSLQVNAAFGTQPGDVSTYPTWTDITTRVIDEEGASTIKASRGRDYELTQPEAGSLNLTLDNHDGAFLPTNSGSPYFPNVLPECPVQVLATWNGKTYGVGTGWASKWPQNFVDPQYGQTNFESVDGIGQASQVKLTSAYAGDVLTDSPYAYFRLGENYTPAGGFPFNNSSRTNIKPAYGVDDNVRPNGVPLTTGQIMNLAGDASTGVGTTAVAQNFSGGPGVIYRDNDLPTLDAGFTVEFWAAVPKIAGNEVTSLIRVIGPPSNYANPGGTRLQVLTENGASFNFDAIIEDFAGNQTFMNSTSAVTDANLHHYVVTAINNGGTWTLSAYIDGGNTYQNTVTNSIAGSNLTVSAIEIGPVLTGGGNNDLAPYTIGQVAVYPYVLDTTRILQHYSTGHSAAAFGLIRSRVARLFTWSGAGLDMAATVNSPSPLLGNADQIEGQSLTDAVYDLTVDEGGMFYCDGFGNNWYQTRVSLYNKTAKYTLGDAPGETPYESADFNFDDTFIYNTVNSQRTISSSQESIQGGGGKFATAQFNQYGADAIETDFSSQTQYMPRGPLEQGVETTSDQDAYDRSNWSLTKYKQPVLRASKVVLNPGTNSSIWPVALGVEQGDIVQVNRRPIGSPEISVLCIVQKVEHDIGPRRWVTSLSLTPYFPENAVIQLDNASFNTLGSGALAW